MVVIICGKYGNNRSRTENVTERTRFQNQGRMTLKRSMSKVITCYTPSPASDHLYQIWKESIHNCRRYRANTIFKVNVEWPWRYRSRSKVITCNTPSHASDHLYQLWKESIKNCRCYSYRADTIFKAKAKWPWRYRSRSKVIICNTPSHTSDYLYQIWKESIENCNFFKVKAEIFKKFAKNSNFQILKKSNTRHTP